MGTSKASARWQGSLKEGQGSMKPAHGSEAAFGFNSRFEGGAGSNPEELIGAALAGCYSMALTGALGRAEMNPQEVNTTAEVQLEKLPEGFRITRIDLVTVAKVPAADAAKFQQIAEETKNGCPISKALNAPITLKASLA
jgi:osmotically inducible protein OsmC